MVTVTVEIINDDIFEGTQSFNLVLESTSAPHVVIGAYNQTTVYIMDDEIITVSFSQHLFFAMEGDGYIAVGVNASLPSGGTEVEFSVGTTVTPGTAQGEELNAVSTRANIRTYVLCYVSVNTASTYPMYVRTYGCRYDKHMYNVIC